MESHSEQLLNYMCQHTRVFEGLFFFPKTPRDRSKNVKYRHKYQNNSRWERSRKVYWRNPVQFMLQICWYLSDNLDSTSVFLLPVPKHHMLRAIMKWHLSHKSDMEMLYLNSTVMWKYVLWKLQEAICRRLQKRSISSDVEEDKGLQSFQIWRYLVDILFPLRKN